MGIKPALNQFNGGEISPQLEGRFDWDKYNYSAKLCKNFIPLIEGSLKRRGGSHFVTETEEIPQYRIYFRVNFPQPLTQPVRCTIYIDGEPHEMHLVSYFLDNYPCAEYEMYAEFGTKFEYTIDCEGFIPIYNNISVTTYSTIEVVRNLISLDDAATLTITTDPVFADVYINGIKRNTYITQKGSKAEIRLECKGTVIYDTLTVDEDMSKNYKVPFHVLSLNQKVSKGTFTVPKGIYWVQAFAGSGGAAGGYDGKHTKTTGGGGGSGAIYVGRIRLEGTYNYGCGNGGNGGRKGVHDGQSEQNGGDAESTFISGIITLDGGKGGKVTSHDLGGFVIDGGGKGGDFYIHDATRVKGTPIHGVDGRYGIGGAITGYNFPCKGGNGNYTGAGDAGSIGSLVISYEEADNE